MTNFSSLPSDQEEQREMKKVIRECLPSEKAILNDIRRQAWEIAYSHIYDEDTIRNNFEGNISERRTWTSIHCTYEDQTLVCEIGSHIVGFATFNWTPNSTGELKSLYVSPKHWNKKIGSFLWDAVMNICRKENLESFDIWVLNRARSSEFYTARGCKLVLSGDYFVGDHKETAECYRWHRMD